jgi:hypothetical protein
MRTPITQSTWTLAASAHVRWIEEVLHQGGIVIVQITHVGRPNLEDVRTRWQGVQLLQESKTISSRKKCWQGSKSDEAHNHRVAVRSVLTFVTAGILAAESMKAVGPGSPHTHSMFSQICTTSAPTKMRDTKRVQNMNTCSGLQPRRCFRCVYRRAQVGAGRTFTGKDFTQERNEAHAACSIFSSLA